MVDNLITGEIYTEGEGPKLPSREVSRDTLSLLSEHERVISGDHCNHWSSCIDETEEERSTFSGPKG